MSKPLESIVNWVAKHFRKDASKMLIWTGVAGWTLSSLAQIGAILFNSKLSKEEKSFLIPQELADAAVNIGSFFLVTQAVKKGTAKLFSTGKIAPKSVKKYLSQNKELYGNKIGKIDFNLDKIAKVDKKFFPQDEYWSCKNFYTTLATVGGGVLSSNIITPIVRNNMASNMQKNYLNQQGKNNIYNNNTSTSTTKIYPKNSSMKI